MLQSALQSLDPGTLEGAVLMRWHVVGELAVPEGARTAISTVNGDQAGDRIETWDVVKLLWASWPPHPRSGGAPPTLPPGLF